MENKKNEFKFSTLRQFGSENISYTATIYSDKIALGDDEVKEQVDSIDSLIRFAFSQSEMRANDEREILSKNADKRAEGIRQLDKSLQDEIQAKKDAQKTVQEAQRISNKITKK